jgi:uncharacterized repeat protein (TIGR01451 family)
VLRVLTLLAWSVAPFIADAAAPILYGTPAYQSPVRADPDDLLLLPGYGLSGGDSVVYRAISGGIAQPEHPAARPNHSTEMIGLADLVSAADAPYALTVHLPSFLKKDQEYEFWVVNPLDQWSKGIRINDARPLWVTPNEIYASAPLAGHRRELKVVGRNLEPAQGTLTRVRLSAPGASFTLLATPSENPAIDRYVARIALPEVMPPGEYRVEVSRNGANWVTLQQDANGTAQSLQVVPNPSAPRRFAVGEFAIGECDPSSGACTLLRGRCRADGDDHDQTRCVVAAIAAAQAAGGGVVEFSPGTWTMSAPGNWSDGARFSNKGVSRDGVLVPAGVSLRGIEGPADTVVVRGEGWNMDVPTFALEGHNRVSGITFRDAHVYGAKDLGAGMLSLGVRLDRRSFYHAVDPNAVSHVVIEDNVFDKPFYAIDNGGLAIDHLFITNNVFGAYKTSIVLEGNWLTASYRFHYSDSAVTSNIFFPGSYQDSAIRQGAIASGLSGGYRTDFSDNRADGTSTAFLYDPASDARGWRATHFWAMHDNVEMSLVSGNSASCTGDKDGDGEAIAYDYNHNRPGFADIAVPVVAATSTPSSSTVTLDGSLIETQVMYGSAIDVRPVERYYVGDWLQILQGPGIGEARKVSSIRVGSGSEHHTVTLTVSPPLDVLPGANSLVSLGRIFWQTYTVGNAVDQRRPLCLKSNRTRQAGGMITLYAPTVDSAVEGNSQYDTSGISVVHEFEASDRGAGIAFPAGFAQSFDEIRGNRVIGTYDLHDRTPQAEYGIALGYGATPHTAPPPVISYGLAISHNTVDRAAGPKGAVSFNQGWYTGPTSATFQGTTPWKIADSTLVFKNTLTDLGESGSSGVGIGISAGSPATPIEWRSVLYGNVCQGALPAGKKLVDWGTQTVRFCPAAPADACECAGAPTTLAVTGEADHANATVGGVVTYSLLVENRGAAPATRAELSAELPGGIELLSMDGAGSACDFHEATVRLCHLGNIERGAVVRIRAQVRIRTAGAQVAVFSVTHREADTEPRNNSAAIVTVASRAD